MAGETHGSWPEFRRARISPCEILVDPDGRPAEALRVDMMMVAVPATPASRASWEESSQGWTASTQSVSRTTRRMCGSSRTVRQGVPSSTSSAGRTGWLEFEADDFLVVEIGLADEDEVWARLDRSS